MKISQQPTNHILVKASCQSEWDNCNFAIITCDEGWAERMEKRLESAASHVDDTDFQSIKYYDGSAEFYVSQEGEEDKLLTDAEKEKEWVFVELEENEEDDFDCPENRLDCYTQVLLRDGTIRYGACGKHTGEKFYTERFPLREIVKQIRENRTTE